MSIASKKLLYDNSENSKEGSDLEIFNVSDKRLYNYKNNTKKHNHSISLYRYIIKSRLGLISYSFNKEIEKIAKFSEDRVKIRVSEPNMLIENKHAKKRFNQIIEGGNQIIANIMPKPATYIQAINSAESKEWKKAMQAEINSLAEQNYWILIDSPKYSKILRGR